MHDYYNQIWKGCLQCFWLMDKFRNWSCQMRLFSDILLFCDIKMRHYNATICFKCNACRIICLLWTYICCLAACPTTGGGNGNQEGDECVFPFTYNFVSFTTYCTTDGEPGPWCYTVPNAVQGFSPWGFCPHNCGMPNGKSNNVTIQFSTIILKDPRLRIVAILWYKIMNNHIKISKAD